VICQRTYLLALEDLAPPRVVTKSSRASRQALNPLIDNRESQVSSVAHAVLNPLLCRVAVTTFHLRIYYAYLEDTGILGSDANSIVSVARYRHECVEKGPWEK
jgi:hypothetical protein